ncbi:MAG: HAD family phosphatase [Verrucomicrobiota bacterium]|nr:HAD family phosphatase [Verrucomicrobiota bacterium]
MNWVSSFQLFLFDFDGLLVDTERLHFRAYREALQERGHFLDWDFSSYCRYAHLEADSLKKALIGRFPVLSLDWSSFYEEKRSRYLSLMNEGQLELMPGVERLLFLLTERGARRCVVTHSPRAAVERICSKLPLLHMIPHWITREDYKEPKPHPECYRKAISLYGKKGDRIIGFEDSVRGWTALSQTEALPLLICSDTHPQLRWAQGALHFASFMEINEGKLLLEF